MIRTHQQDVSYPSSFAGEAQDPAGPTGSPGRIALHDLDEFSFYGWGAAPGGAAPGAGGAFALEALEEDPEWRLGLGRGLPLGEV